MTGGGSINNVASIVGGPSATVGNIVRAPETGALAGHIYLQGTTGPDVPGGRIRLLPSGSLKTNPVSYASPRAFHLLPAGGSAERLRDGGR